MIVPSWLAWARHEIGTAEIVGPQHSERVLQYWTLSKIALRVTDDETPWCAAFACAALEANKVTSPRSARARGFAESPQMIPCDLRLGAIVVLSSDRGAASGHVGFLDGVSPGKVHLIGGNQGNRVALAPFSALRIVATVWPKAAPEFSNYPLAPTVGPGGQGVSDR